jgi:DMSO/TMAO reductase YedYZ molybdopterin-dependent catalytic subunit
MERRSTRREFFSRSLALAAIVAARRVSAAQRSAGEQFLGTVPLSGPKATPLNRLLLTGLDARLFTDLSGLTPDLLITPNDRFYVRTAGPDAARIVSAWKIQIGGLVRRPSDIAADDLRRRAEDLGTCLLECSGNSDPDNFGLISAANWRGVRLSSVFRSVERLPEATHVRISGLDHDRSPSGTSVPGASWIFALDELAEAFLATGMNGQTLSLDHGAPIRLVVPGWYGCVAIKWVNAIEFVGDRVPPTAQMVEFAARTHQRGVPALARDFVPATVDHAALPVRIEHWSLSGRPVYRVVGIQWGGDTPSNALEIRFHPDSPFVRVSDCPLPKSTRTWSLWTHEWMPEAPGRYEISLRFSDDAIRTRRLDMDFYRRAVTIPSS